jgi:hypothetical protein
VKIQKNAQFAVRLAQEGEPVVGTMIKQEVNIWDKFNMGGDDLARKLGSTGPKTSAVILELGIQGDTECYRELRRKSSLFKGYSKRALDVIRDALKNGLDVERVWIKHRHRFGAAKRI